MIFPEVDTETWRQRFKLSMMDVRCAGCGKLFKTTVPVLVEDCAGLATPVHECGERFIAAVLKPRTKAAKEFWGSVVTTA